MKYQIEELSTLTIVGISVRTNNNGNAQEDIAKLWNDFFAENILETIPHKISNDIYCVYTDYESNYTGDYTTILGCLVNNTENISSELIVKQIPTCKYNKFVSEGKIPECVANTWIHIWNTEYERKYIADFDIYGEDANDPNNAKVITYLSIK